MKITELETIPLRLPFAQPFKISQRGFRPVNNQAPLINRNRLVI